MHARVDLHIHSRHSARSAEWLLRRFDVPDSCSEPRTVYDRLRERGMTFVTLTDHNEIGGCLEIADLPGVFMSEEVTSYFPGDRAKVHLLVWGITEAQHREIGEARQNVVELQRYLEASAIAHAVAHPLYRVDQQFGTPHLEQLVLLFRHFEGINGLRHHQLGDTLRFALGALTPERVAEFADRHGFAPTHPEPWRKVFVGGSDDHGGMFAGSAWTEVSHAATPAEFLASLRQGGCTAGGEGGTPLKLSHGVYNTVYHFLSQKYAAGSGPTLGLVEKAFSRFMEGQDPTQFTVREKLGFLAQGIASGKLFELANPKRPSLWKNLSELFDGADLRAVLAREVRGVKDPERRAFLMANRIANEITFRFFNKFVREISAGAMMESIQTASGLLPVVLALSPYLYAFQSQSAPRSWMAEACRALAGSLPPALETDRRAWFTDTLDDVNGVATTIKRMAGAAQAQGADLTVFTCRTGSPIPGIAHQNVEPVGEFALPEYELQKLSFPPILNVLDAIHEGGYRELIISTPGPLGLTALLAGRMLGLHVSAIYHTDFPQYVRILTDDSFMETLTWNYMHWFYGQADTVYVNSEHYRTAWAERGIARDRLHILPRGLDTRLFHPSRRDPGFWRRRGLQEDETGVLYVGRVSKEKNIEVLATACRKLRAKGTAVRMLVVGDGPFLQEFRTAEPDGIFTGSLAGEELAIAYASADLFAFPSTTDTFGNVVLEAQSSGLPCIVSNAGGPCELVSEGVTGNITRALDAKDLARAIAALTADPVRRAGMGKAARASVEDRDWARAFGRFWNRED